MMRIAIILVLAGGLWGCASAPDSRPVAQDPVCLYNNDLGCVKVRVDDKTPRSSYKGTVYFFCAESCRKSFEKEPEKYLATKE